MKGKRKLAKILSIVVMAAMIFTIMAACNNSGTTTTTGSSQGGTTTTTAAGGNGGEELSGEFTYWSCFSGDSAVWEENRVKTYMEAFPDIKVDLQFVPESAGIKNGKLLAAIAGGTAPDLIIADDYSSAYSYAANGSFIPMDEYLAKTTIKTGDFMPAFQDLMKYDGKTYLVPQDSNVIFLYYNTDMFEEAGLDVAAPPKTVDKLDEYADKLTKTAADGSYERFGFIPWIDNGGDAFVLPFVWGSQIYDKDANKLVLTDEPMVELFTWLQSYAEKYDPEKIDSFTSGFGGMFSPDHPFMTGKVAMTITGNWFTNALRIYAPDVNYAVAPIPTPTEARYGTTTLNSNVFAMPKGSDQQALAAHFMEFCMQPEVNEANFAEWRSIPTIDASFDAVSHTKNNDPIYKVEREMANNPNSGHPALTKVSAELSIDMIAARDDVIYNSSDPMTVLKALEDKFQSQLN